MSGEKNLSDAAFYFCTVAVLVGMALFHLWQVYQVMDIKWEISALKSEHQRLGREADKLQEEFWGLCELARVEREAKMRGFVKPKPGELLVLANASSDHDGVGDVTH